MAHSGEVMEDDVLVNETLAAVRDDQRRLTTLEPWVDLSFGLLTIHTTTRSLAIARRGTATLADALVVGAPVVGQAGEDGCASGLDGEGGEEGNEGRRRGRY